MKNFPLAFLAVIFLSVLQSNAQNNSDRDKKITDLISKITLEEKVGHIFPEAGVSQVVEFHIGKEDLAFVNADLKWVTEPGGFELMVDSLKASFTYIE
jgi:hypothetical protein